MPWVLFLLVFSLLPSAFHLNSYFFCIALPGPGGVNHDLAHDSFAYTVCAYALNALKGQVDQPTLPCSQWLKCYRASGFLGLFCHTVRKKRNALLLFFPIALCFQLDPGMAFDLVSQNTVNNIFQCIKILAFFSYNKGKIFS